MKKEISLNHKTILITGCAGFIGMHLTLRLLRECKNSVIVGIDALTDYNPVELKEWRLEKCRETARCSDNSFFFYKADIADKPALDEIVNRYKPAIVVHLAAQAGVRHSMEEPYSFVKSNLIGMMNVLESCRSLGGSMEHLVFASSSSVYGENEKAPFSLSAPADRPVSLYAATKRSDELLAYSYAALYDISVTGLRLFSVYGPAGRPDMAYYLFTKKWVNGETIDLYDHGNGLRDFTYVEDTVEGLFRVMRTAPAGSDEPDRTKTPPYALYNIGNERPVKMMDFVKLLEEELKAQGVLADSFRSEEKIRILPGQPGDVSSTCADMSAMERDFGFRPQTSLGEGIRSFVKWYKAYHFSDP